MSLSSVYDPVQYPFWTINYFLILWLLSKVAYHVLLFSKLLVPDSVRETFHNLSEEKRRTAVTYVLEVVVTTVILFAQVLGGVDLLFRREDPTLEQGRWVAASLVLLSVLYAWELIYRERFGWPLLIHHLLTLLLIQLVAMSFQQTQKIQYLRFALIMGMYATTEQLSFVALFCFRMKLLSQTARSRLLLAAAIKTFIIKASLTMGAIAYCIIVMLKDRDFNEGSDPPESYLRGDNWGRFWTFVFIPLLLAMFASQLYACKILFALSRRGLEKPTSQQSTSIFVDSSDEKDIDKKRNDSANKRDEELGTDGGFSDD